MITIAFNRLPIRPGWRILDIGCGSGRHACQVGARRDVTVIGADPSHADLLAAADRFTEHKRWGALACREWALAAADALDLSFPDHAFDLVVCSEVLEHLHDPDRALAELARVTRPGGYLAVSVPRQFPEQLCWKFCRTYPFTNGGHVRIFRHGELTHRLKNAGFTILGHHFAHALHSPYWWLKCLGQLAPEPGPLVRLYHRFLVWDMMKRPAITRWMERLLNPILGKSLVIYTRRQAPPCL